MIAWRAHSRRRRPGGGASTEDLGRESPGRLRRRGASGEGSKPGGGTGRLLVLRGAALWSHSKKLP